MEGITRYTFLARYTQYLLTTRLLTGSTSYLAERVREQGAVREEHFETHWVAATAVCRGSHDEHLQHLLGLLNSARLPGCNDPMSNCVSFTARALELGRSGHSLKFLSMAISITSKE